MICIHESLILCHYAHSIAIILAATSSLFCTGNMSEQSTMRCITLS